MVVLTEKSNRNHSFLTLLIVVFGLIVFETLNGTMFLHSSSNSKSETEKGWIRPSQIFGHIHRAKTAGTEINGELASRFERICGHKGYSYDFSFSSITE